MQEHSPIREFPDRSVRAFLERPALLVAFVELLDPALAGRIDPASVERLDPATIDEEYGKRESDLLWRCSFRGGDGRELLIYCVMEHQSDPDPWLPFRLLFAMTRLWERERREGKLPLSVILPILFYTGDQAWPAPQRMQALVEAPPELADYVPSFRIATLDLKGCDPAPLAASEHPLPAALLAWREERAEEAVFVRALVRAGSRLSVMGEEAQEDWRVLVRFRFGLVLHRRVAEERGGLIQALCSNIESRRRQEAEQMYIKGSSVDVWMEEGALKALRATLLAQLTAKFGPLPEGVVTAVNCCADRARVEGWLARILAASTLEEMGIED